MVDAEDEVPGNSVGEAPDARDISTLHGRAVTKAKESIRYYQTKKWWPRLYARMVRLGAIVLICVAGIVPLLDAAGLFPFSAPEIPEDATAEALESILAARLAEPADSGQIALLMAAVAAALLAADRFFGFSSTWARFTTTELTLKRTLDRFVFDWALSFASEESGGDPGKLTTERLELLKAFSMEVSQINEDETRVWVAEYQNALATLERTARERKEQLEAGSLHIGIERSEKVRGPVRVLVDGKLRRENAGDLVIVRQVAPGQHLLEVAAQDEEGNALRETRAVDVPSGGMIRLTVGLG